MRKASALALSMIFMVTGCAATSSPEEINQSAAMWYASQACAQAGLMDQDTAAKGMAMASSSISAADTDRVRARIRDFESSPNGRPNQQACNMASLKIKTLVEGRAIQASTPSAPAYTPPKTVNCSTVMGWTHCTQF